jgi:hypothetical protein
MSENIKKNQLNEKQKTAIEGILSCRMSMKEVAESVGVTPETVSRWKAQPDFQIELQARRSEIWQDIHDRAKDACALALEVLISCLRSPDERLKQSTAIVFFKMNRFQVDSPDLPELPGNIQAGIDALDKLQREAQEYNERCLANVNNMSPEDKEHYFDLLQELHRMEDP